ncbi:MULTISPECIES: peptidase domain-containing ABC transporter [unclassified Chitinophaga]|uniref:peptidase domain-containing ABC transporter n=1 Tax=unclassified Chitinophaga TaxID=2619133 RepID=UPI0009CDA702|nr:MULTISPECIES: peptidase domain-containing ABC transporter [unclassified Chitinophaga]OMP75129.1 ABC transporter ATP-binding protein [[Flexibacter] sp. ATCC 35208]WPV66921.1 peptidase domain-containing ABC transporter [Chitinophaga sp. LS1]
MGRKRFFYRQHDSIDCGPTCLKMIARFYGKLYPLDYLRERCFISREGVSLLSISEAAESIGFRTQMAYVDMDLLVNDCPFPAILHWDQNHFVVLYGIKKALLTKKIYFIVADPAFGIVALDEEKIHRSWISTFDNKGTILLLEPSSEFRLAREVREKRLGYGFLLNYLSPFKKHIVLLIGAMLGASLISLSFPFLTRLLIDEGVSRKNISLVYLVLLSQLFLFIGSTVIDFIRSWLLLHINARISLHIISDFLSKLLRLPLKFFETKAVGDLSQRINDHHRIENFLTGTVLTSIFSLINMLLFTAILAYFSCLIFSIFAILSVISVGWIFLFQKKREQLDYKRFATSRENQDKLYETIIGMQEIKLFGSEANKRNEWEQLQVKNFNLGIKALALEQYQQSGFIFINTIKNIVVSFLAASYVIKGDISLGVLLSISYITGQINGPIEQLVSFIKASQDARLSIDRLQEIFNKEDEESHSDQFQRERDLHRDIIIDHLSFQYEGPNSPFVLKDISMVIPKGRITAIVGTSGSGKTTLLKLLLGFYKPVKGEIMIGESPLHTLSPGLWRGQCGTVMQEGYIFYDTIAGNIAMNGEEIDDQLMEKAVVTANLMPFIEGLPLAYTTKIGASGLGISGGQKQRILIARAVYKNPHYIFFDEATSNLDTNNERVIMENLNEFLKGKTVVIIAHRLSTVRNADQIIVLENGHIVETGNHDRLVKNKYKYFELVKNQLELGS